MQLETLVTILRAEIAKIKMPHSSDKVYKDECMYSFDSPFSEGGLYVNLQNFHGVGKDYLSIDHAISGCNVYLHEKWLQLPKKIEVSDEAESKSAPFKLAIGTEGGFMTEATHEIIKEHFLVVFNGKNFESFPLPITGIPEFISNVLQSVINHDGMKSAMQISSWNAESELFVSKYATTIEQINPTGHKISQDPKHWKDEETGDTENLWLNLSTGYIGGGRKNWDGTGGSGSALNHYLNTGKRYPLVVKLGTITRHGADVYSYAADEDNMVIDPLLAEHLSFWGIDVMKLEKTAKTLVEMEVALNMSYDWSRILDGENELEAIEGAGYVGLHNIGSSCYMNSVLQTILAVPEVQERYLLSHDRIVETAPLDPSTDFLTQMSKVAVAVLTDRYVPPLSLASSVTESSSNNNSNNNQNNNSCCKMDSDSKADVANTVATSLEKYIVAPRMFKHLVGKNHPEFSTNRQQDVSEFFQYLLITMSKAEKAHLPRLTAAAAAVGSGSKLLTASIFEYHVQLRYESMLTGEVKYIQRGPQTLCNILELPVPLDKIVTLPAKAVAVADSKEEVDPSSSAAAGKRARIGEMKQQQSKHSDAALDGCHKMDVDNEDGQQKQSSSSSGSSRKEEKEEAVLEEFISFQDCLNSWLAAETVDMRCGSSDDTTTTCSKTTLFATFPRYLMMKLSRYYAGANWVQQKVNARIDVPEHLDLTSFKGEGKQSHERCMTDNNSSSSNPATSTAAVEFVVDEGIVAQLMSMGFSEHGCRRAVIATRNADVDTAMNWVFEHMEDADFNEPPLVTTTTTTVPIGNNVDSESASMLASMGYSIEQATAALIATDNNIERAADWLFSHSDDLDIAVAQILNTTVDIPAAASIANNDCDDTTSVGEGKYTLIAIISHIGKSTDHGHYVCHIKKQGQWVLFNDEKVGKCKKAPLEHGFMYLYKRDDGPGSLKE